MDKGRRFLDLRRLSVVSALAAVACVVALPVEMQTDYAHSKLDLPGDINKALNLSEVFAHGLGAFVILFTTWLVSKHRRRAIWMAAMMTLVSGLVANGMKAIFVRIRPHSAEQITVRDRPQFAIAIPSTNRVADVDNVLVVVPISFWDSRQRSFPSGHAAVATALALGLSIVFPRGAWMFLLLAVLACLQRISSGAHFPSDVLAGVAIAFLCGTLILWFDARSSIAHERRGD